VIVRHFKKPARISEFLRITIGSEPQNQALIQAIRELLGA
jgi:histidinol-phosphate aminotransferase